MDRMAWRSMTLAAFAGCGVFALSYYVGGSFGFYMEAISFFNILTLIAYVQLFGSKNINSKNSLMIVTFIALMSVCNLISVFSIFSFEDYMSGDKLVHNFEYKKLIHIALNFVTLLFAVRFLIWSIKPQADKASSADGGLVSLRELFPDGVWAATEQGYLGHLPDLGEVELVAEDSGWRGVCEGAVVEGCFSAPNALMQLAHIRGNTRAVSA